VSAPGSLGIGERTGYMAEEVGPGEPIVHCREGDLAEHRRGTRGALVRIPREERFPSPRLPLEQ
jgi:hypothetical protein